MGNCIISRTNDNSIYETKQHASETYETKDNVSNNFVLKSSLVNLIYPIGSIYISTNSSNPTNLFGGTWEKIKDRFLLASGNSYSLESTGGEASHTLTISEMPAHNHRYKDYYTLSSATDSSKKAFCWESNEFATSTETTVNTGGSAAHNNMPPYLVVNIWKRTA